MKAWQWVLAGAAIGTLLACATIPTNSNSAASDIFYTSQREADVALDQFDKDNPSCQLWTNWQKMCSRTGENGQTLCQSTHQHGIRPSTPFCAAKENGGTRRAALSDDMRQIRSSLRFCQYPAGKPADLASQIQECVYSKYRPFSGRDLSDRQHPWCKVWYEAGKPRPASSSRLAPYELYCADRNVPHWCVWPDGVGFGPDLEMIRRMRNKESSDDVILGTLINPDSISVRGVFCRRRSK